MNDCAKKTRIELGNGTERYFHLTAVDYVQRTEFDPYYGQVR
jgi:hypothetical protein